MEDADKAAAQRHRAGYFQQYLARMAPTPLPPPPLPFPSSSSKPKILARAANGRKNFRNDGKPKVPARETARKSLVDAFKQHGMKLCDGSKLNAVAKGVTLIGVIPPTLSVHITALYLSQNELGSLDGIVQFRGVRLLSLTGNVLTQFSDVERLQQLPQLKNLNLMGNPLCGQPNYRLRVVDTLQQLHILDTVEVSKHERELASLVASQNRAMREMVMKNHLDIQKLQRLAVWIRVLGEFQCLVLREAITGRFDQLPSPSNSVDIDSFLKFWRVEDTLSGAERDALETQMLSIIARTKAKMLEDTPQTKATEMLLKLANGSVAVAQRRWHGKGKEIPQEMQRECNAWEDAYVHVLQLQQQTVANLRGECDRHRRAVVDKQQQLVLTNPYKRRQLEPDQEPTAAASHQQSSIAPIHIRSQVSQRSVQVAEAKLTSREISEEHRAEREPYQVVRRAGLKTERKAGAMRPSQANQRRILRSGEFGNKTLHEAISSFTLRQPKAVSSNKLPQRPAMRLNTTTFFHVNASEAVFDAGFQATDQSARHETLAKRPTLLHARPNSATTDSFSDLESCGMTASETVCSMDASSVGGSSIDRSHRGFKYQGNPFVTASSAQHHQRQDPVRQQWLNNPQELHTVVEDNESQLEDHPFDDKVCGYEDEVHKPHNHTMVPRLHGDRQHELEAREEKYIAALMESEQRELDLRQQISAMHQQLSQFQRLVCENDSERRKIKEEISARASSVARPTLLRRFFLKWIRYCQWAMQLRHVERKRRFVTQHDAFWNWRRKVWIQEQLRRIRHRQSLRVLRCHLTEWANLTRISVIAVHTQALRQSHLLQQIMGEWRQYAFVQKHVTLMLADHENASSTQLLATSFSEWAKTTRKIRQMQHFHQFYSRGGETSWKRLVLSKWKIFVLSVARPERERATKLASKLQAARRRHHFLAWKRVVKCERLDRVCSRRRAWDVWRRCLLQRRLRREQVVSSRSETLRSHFAAWRCVGSDRLLMRRALSLATRHVNQRRLRKLWIHWKAYSVAQKRHMQGASKAFKHYFVKLLRKTWGRWKQETRANLISVKQTKQKELQFHFNALCRGVNRVREEKKRLVFVIHASRRRQLALTRKTFSEWAVYTKQRRRCKAIHSVLSGQRSKALVGFVWSQWKYEHMLKLKRMLLKSTRQYKSIEAEKHETEQELSDINDRSISLCEQVRQLTQRVETQSADSAAFQNELLTRERAVVELENHLTATKNQMQRSNAEHELLIKREQAANRALNDSVFQLQDENKALKRRISDLEIANEAMTQSVDAEGKERSVIEARLHDLTAESDTLRRAIEDQERSLSATIQDLTRQLDVEQQERDDTVRRLQEYEARIASTCAEIGDHEKAHEEERIALRTDNVRLEYLRKEEAVRNGELQRLLSEKNDQIIALSVRLKDQETLQKDAKRANSRSPRRDSPSIPSEVEIQDQNAAANPVEAGKSSADGYQNEVSQEVQLDQAHDEVSNKQQVLATSPVSVVTPQPVKLEPSEEELQIDARTSRIHADIQLLQERISKRLQQIPCVPPVDEITRRGHLAVKMFALESDSGSVSTISESEQEERKPRRRIIGSRTTATGTGASTAKGSSFKGTKRATGKASERESDRENAPRAANVSKQSTPTLASRVESSSSVKRLLQRTSVTTEAIKTKKSLRAKSRVT